jgi:CHRD domain-containing protein
MRRILLAATLALAMSVPAFADNGGGLKFKAKLAGGDLNGNVIATPASGDAKLSIIDNGDGVLFEVKIQGIRNLWQAHIHVAAQGPVAPNQPVGPVVFFFVPTTGGAQNDNIADEFNGTMAAGVVMTDQQLVGPLAFDTNNAANTGVAGLIKAIMEQRASIVVHTSDLNNATHPAGTVGAAGDSPAGEIRGLIEPN